MTIKLYDCTLDHWPTVRIAVTLPASAAEVQEQVDDEYLAGLSERMLPEEPTEADLLALEHETTRVNALRQVYQADEKGWLEANHQRLANDPESEPKDFASAFPALFGPSKFADRFAVVDAKAEYFRLYSLISSMCQFKAVEVEPGAPEPEAEHKNWTAIRKQVGTVGTERPRVAPASKAAPVQSSPASEAAGASGIATNLGTTPATEPKS
jgi:hypothetical protein